MNQTEHHIYIAGLISKLMTGSISLTEKDELESWLAESNQNKALFDQLTNPEYLQAEIDQSAPQQNAAWQQLQATLNLDTPVKHISHKKWLRAAAAVLVAGVAALFVYHPHQQPAANTIAAHVQPQKTGLPAGTPHAMLILGNGQKITLNQNKLTLHEKNGTTISNNSHTVSYQAGNNAAATDEVVYNTIIVPRGAEYQLTLADGSKVWMNAASTLKYPTRFTGKTREVYLTGEAYFEVAHNAAQPFTVKTDKADVRVLGTHFNVMAYADEDAYKTTLLQGSVSVLTPAGNNIIKPGQQDIVKKDGSQAILNDIDTDEETAWKNGMFVFKDANIEDIMRKAARWYDLNVVYEGKAPDILFNGKMSRKVDFNGLVTILKYAGFHIKVNGNTITINR